MPVTFKPAPPPSAPAWTGTNESLKFTETVSAPQLPPSATGLHDVTVGAPGTKTGRKGKRDKNQNQVRACVFACLRVCVCVCVCVCVRVLVSLPHTRACEVTGHSTTARGKQERRQEC